MLRSPSIALPRGVLVEDAADASRRALRAFVALDPDKLSLATWLVGLYGEATSFGPHGIRRVRPDALPRAHPITATSIEDLVTVAKTVVIAALAATHRGVDDLVALLPSVVQVVPAHDVRGTHGFIPIDVAHIRLVDRVMALLVADYLTRPDEFRAYQPPLSGTRSTQPSIEFFRDAPNEADARSLRA